MISRARIIITTVADMTAFNHEVRTPKGRFRKHVPLCEVSCRVPHSVVVGEVGGVLTDSCLRNRTQMYLPEVCRTSRRETGQS